jgi:hypothetical protein
MAASFSNFKEHLKSMFVEREKINMCSTGVSPPSRPPEDGGSKAIKSVAHHIDRDTYTIHYTDGSAETVAGREIEMDPRTKRAIERWHAVAGMKEAEAMKQKLYAEALAQSSYNASLAAYQSQALQNTTSISGLAGTGMLGVPTTGSGLMGTASITYNPYGTYVVPSTIPSTGSYTTITYDGIPGVQTTTAAKTRQKLTGGDLIVCKNDHPICIVMEDFEVGSEGDWRSKMGFWQQDKTSTDLSPQDYDCEICKASFTRAAPEYLPGHAFIVRPAPKEETESE